MVKLMQDCNIGTGSFREDGIEDDIDYRGSLRSVLAIVLDGDTRTVPLSDNRVTWISGRHV